MINMKCWNLTELLPQDEENRLNKFKEAKEDEQPMKFQQSHQFPVQFLIIARLSALPGVSKTKSILMKFHYEITTG